MNTENLKKSCMAFELTDGKVLLIHEEDIQKLVEEFWVKMVTMKQTHCYMVSDSGLKRGQELYKVYLSEKSNMNEEVKQNYLNEILKQLSGEDYELSTLEKMVKKKVLEKP